MFVIINAILLKKILIFLIPSVFFKHLFFIIYFHYYLTFDFIPPFLLFIKYFICISISNSLTSYH